MPMWFGSQVEGADTSPEDGTSQERGRRVLPSTTWLQREVEQLARQVDDRSPQGTRRRHTPVPWMHAGKSSSQLRDAIADDNEAEVEEEEVVVPLARRDTPAPWLTENDLLSEKMDREKYVLGLLEKILEEPTDSEAVFDKLHKIAE
ncbi:uncharacterized protein LOC126335953 [Schistocerca gregaria]|uniref:uncharacterized protein LOC126335953 n=1 Tax=Schistocerca gregaria TaxID=7010 RepID=UPI00211DE428|nr:uncharacterized protein LOC126335953 [Schistocerca gregaria]